MDFSIFTNLETANRKIRSLSVELEILRNENERYRHLLRLSKDSEDSNNFHYPVGFTFTPAEYSIINELILSYPSSVKNELLHLRYSPDPFSDNSTDPKALHVHVYRIRKKLKPYVKEASIVNVRGVGYLLTNEAFKVLDSWLIKSK